MKDDLSLVFAVPRGLQVWLATSEWLNSSEQADSRDLLCSFGRLFKTTRTFSIIRFRSHSGSRLPFKIICAVGGLIGILTRPRDSNCSL
jgi:hypothetical protein